MLIIDDLQFFVGKRATQVELLHTVDTLMRERRQLVFAADRSPAELAELGPELTTRLASGMVCRIEPPDYATRLGIVAQMARRMKLHVPADVQEYVASRLTNHARELSGALCRLQATSEALGKPITLAMADESLREMIHNSTRMVRLGDIEKAVCQVFGLEPQSLQADDKSKSISHPRMLAMWLAQAYPGGIKRNRPLLRPAQPQHRGLGAKTRGSLGGLRAARSIWPSGPGPWTRPSATSNAIWPRDNAIGAWHLILMSHKWFLEIGNIIP